MSADLHRENIIKKEMNETNKNKERLMKRKDFFFIQNRAKNFQPKIPSILI